MDKENRCANKHQRIKEGFLVERMIGEFETADCAEETMHDIYHHLDYESTRYNAVTYGESEKLDYTLQAYKDTIVLSSRLKSSEKQATIVHVYLMSNKKENIEAVVNLLSNRCGLRRTQEGEEKS